jgi:hypothetical protein
VLPLIDRSIDQLGSMHPPTFYTMYQSDMPTAARADFNSDFGSAGPILAEYSHEDDRIEITSYQLDACMRYPPNDELLPS